ncbi:MAG: recombination protein RecR [Phycisphaerae bacterium]|nr:recombination protein RecR [Phycisphaerae bacterium]
MSYPESVNTLIDEFSRMPGIGRRSAERLAFHVLKSSTDEAMGLSDAIRRVKESVRHCSVCWNLADDDPCPICRDERRDASVVLVVEQPRDLISLEQTGMHGGVYHVLLGRLDPLDGVGPEGLTVDDLLARLRDPARNARGVEVKEIVLGLNPDMEGDTTALHVAEEARKLGIRTTRLARGLPSGSQIEYASRAVLADAITERRPLD